MPNVPKLPGVPNLSSYAAGAVVQLLLTDAFAAAFNFGEPRWGIFLDGEQALDFNSMLGFNYKQDWTISDYPVEEGAFQSYDKVQLPFDARVKIVSGGTAAERQELLAAIDEIANSLELYDIVTPERTYTSVNVNHYDYDRRADKNLGMIAIDVWFTEVRVTATSEFSSTQQPSEAGRQNVGNVQPQPPSGDLAKAISARPTPVQ